MVVPPLPREDRARSAVLAVRLGTVSIVSWTVATVGGLLTLVTGVLTDPRDPTWVVGLGLAGIAGARLRRDVRRRRRMRQRLGELSDPDRDDEPTGEELRRRSVDDRIEGGRDRTIVWSGIAVLAAAGAVAQLVAPHRDLPVWWVIAIFFAYAVTSVAWEVHQIRLLRVKKRALQQAPGVSAG